MTPNQQTDLTKHTREVGWESNLPLWALAIPTAAQELGKAWRTKQSLQPLEWVW